MLFEAPICMSVEHHKGLVISAGMKASIRYPVVSLPDLLGKDDVTAEAVTPLCGLCAQAEVNFMPVVILIY
jgi:hypothetical protein